MLALAISAMLMAGLTSVMIVAGKASSAAARQTSEEMRTLLDQLREDAAAAISVPQLTTTTLTLTIPDRTGDAANEQVIYDWTNTATTGSVARSFNGVQRLIPVGATGFTITPTIDQRTTTATSTSAETLLFRRTAATTLFPYSIKSNQSCGQRIIPTLPGNALTWSVTRVRLPVRSKGATPGITRVEVRAASAGLPTVILDETQLLESDLLTTMDTREFVFNASNTAQPATAQACVVLHWQKDADAAETFYEVLAAPLAGGQWVASTDGGGTWTTNALQTIPLDVYGTYTLPAGVMVRRLTALSVSLTPREPSLQSPLKTTVRFTNPPQVLG